MFTQDRFHYSPGKKVKLPFFFDFLLVGPGDNPDAVRPSPGCYRLLQLQPIVQDRPIDSGHVGRDLETRPQRRALAPPLPRRRGEEHPRTGHVHGMPTGK